MEQYNNICFYQLFVNYCIYLIKSKHEVILDLNEISSFVSIIENGSLTKAAQQVQIPKSTLSRHLMQLERRLGITLVQRTTRKISLTPSGKQFYESCKLCLVDLQKAEKQLSESHELPKGKIKFTAPIEVGNYFLSETISSFCQKYPEIEFDISFTDRIVDLVREEFDLALRAGRIHDESLVSKKLGGDIFIFVASHDYLQKNTSILKPEDLKAHICWTFSQMNRANEWKVNNGKQTKTIQVEKKLQNNSLQSIKSIIIAGGGIALLPSVLVKESLIVGELVHVLPDWKLEGGSLHLCYPKQKKTPLRVKLFIDYLMKALGKGFNT